MKIFCWFLFVSLLSLTSHAQDLGSLGVKKGVKLTGGVNFNAIGYAAAGIAGRRDPFAWFATGNLNANLFGYDVPLSFSYSNTNRSFSQPFNQFSFAPQYKWVKTYVGYNALTFSPYTLAGHTFLGGGVELTPGRWRVAAMYGRLRRAVPFSFTDSLQHAEATFKRMGYGLKVGYDHEGSTLDVSFFGAKDQANSLAFVLPTPSLVPQQNVAVSLHARQQLWKRLSVEGEYAISALNGDLRAERPDSIQGASSTGNLLADRLPANATTRYFDALNGSLGYQGGWYGVQLRYERVAPEYQTLGAYYFNNDLRNLTVAPNVRLLRNTLNLAGNVGLQRNNLDGTRASTTRRFVGAFNASYAPGEQWNLAAVYSNFTTFTRRRPQADPFFRDNLDSLNFYQLSTAANFTAAHLFGAQQYRQTVMLNASYQQASDRTDYEGGGRPSDFYSTNLAYSLALAPQQMTLSVAGNTYLSQASNLRSLYWGPTLGMSKAWLAKTLKTSLSGSYNQSVTNGTPSNGVFNSRLNLTYSPAAAKKDRGRQNATLGLNLLRRLAGVQPGYRELTTTFNYGYSF